MNSNRFKVAVSGVLALLLLGGMTMFLFWPRTVTFDVKRGDKPEKNPLKGWACWGESGPSEVKYALAYVPVYWAALEKEEGVYDFAALEERYHFAAWREQGTRLVLRVVSDSPDDEEHMDIPQWLYDQMDGDGTWYESGYGKGFSPNYENERFQSAHTALLTALGARYNNDAQVAFIQLGSLGHWGEWHVNERAGIARFPDSTVTDGYVRDYLAAFPDKKLLMRRPYAIVSEEKIGLYNDMFGEAEEHREWMDWIENGYISSQNGQALPGAPLFWQNAPSGGEISSGREIGYYFSEGFEDTLSFIRESHTTYLGPKIPRQHELTDQGWENAQACEREMGYCFTVTQASVHRQRGKDMRLHVAFENIGVAPFYEDWDIRVVLRNRLGAQVYAQDFPTALSSWITAGELDKVLPGTAGLLGQKLTLWVGIVDPLTGECGVALAVDAPCSEGMYAIGTI